MLKGKNYLNIALLILVSILMGTVFYWDFSDVFVFSVNDFLLIWLFIFGLRLSFSNSTKGQYLLLAFILLAVPGIITMNFSVDGSGSSSMTVVHFGSLSFNPLSFLILIFYCLINRHSLMQLFGKVIYGSKEEQNEKEKKLIDFYYDKFNSCSPNEVNDIFKSYNDYPPEAQIALRKINEERNLSLINSNLSSSKTEI